MPALPSVSVILPVYNAEKHIKACLNSLLSQTLQDIEIICIDNGSSDDCGDILTRLAYKDSRVFYISQEHQNEGLVRNNAAALAKGKYLFHMNTADIPAPNLLEELKKIAEQENADIVFNTHREGTSPKESSIIPLFWNRLENNRLKKIIQSQESLNPEELSASVLVTPQYIWNKLFRKDFLLQNNISFCGLYEYENTVFFLDCALAKAKIVYAGIPLYLHPRISETPKPDNRYFDIFKALPLIKKKISKHPEFSLLKESFRFFTQSELIDKYELIPHPLQKDYRKNAEKWLSRKEYNAFLEKTEHVKVFDTGFFRIKWPS